MRVDNADILCALMREYAMHGDLTAGRRAGMVKVPINSRLTPNRWQERILADNQNTIFTAAGIISRLSFYIGRFFLSSVTGDLTARLSFGARGDLRSRPLSFKSPKIPNEVPHD